MHFSYRQKVLFKHCDPAGIVFFPRYFEMINDVVEAMFSDLVGWPFEDMHPEAGVPTAALNTVFSAPSRHGDMLDFRVELALPGRSSLKVTHRAFCGDELRLEAEQTLVLINSEGRAAPWPDTLRDRFRDIIERATS